MRNNNKLIKANYRKVHINNVIWYWKVSKNNREVIICTPCEEYKKIPIQDIGQKVMEKDLLGQEWIKCYTVKPCLVKQYIQQNMNNRDFKNISERKEINRRLKKTYKIDECCKKEQTRCSCLLLSTRN